MPRDIDFVGLRTMRDKYGAVFPAGHLIFRQGDPGREFYVILDGQVDMLALRPDGEYELLAVLRRGDFFGEMAVFRHEPRSATARTRTETSVLYFSARTAGELLINSPRFALGIIRTLCDRIAANDHEIVTLRLALSATRGRATATPQSLAAASAAAEDLAIADDLLAQVDELLAETEGPSPGPPSRPPPTSTSGLVHPPLPSIGVSSASASGLVHPPLPSIGKPGSPRLPNAPRARRAPSARKPTDIDPRAERD